MYLNEAKEFLSVCERIELQDYILGETETTWIVNSRVVATGCFGGDKAIVFINISDEHDIFIDDAAISLSDYGLLVRIVYPWNVPNYGKPDKAVPEYYKNLLEESSTNPRGVETLITPCELEVA